MKTVYVVMWRYNTGGGFDWYRKSLDAEIAFGLEHTNEKVYKSENWRAVTFPFVTKETDPDAITWEIDGQFDELFDREIRRLI